MKNIRTQTPATPWPLTSPAAPCAHGGGALVAEVVPVGQRQRVRAEAERHRRARPVWRRPDVLRDPAGTPMPTKTTNRPTTPAKRRRRPSGSARRPDRPAGARRHVVQLAVEGQPEVEFVISVDGTANFLLRIRGQQHPQRSARGWPRTSPRPRRRRGRRRCRPPRRRACSGTRSASRWTAGRRRTVPDSTWRRFDRSVNDNTTDCGWRRRSRLHLDGAPVPPALRQTSTRTVAVGLGAWRARSQRRTSAGTPAGGRPRLLRCRAAPGPPQERPTPPRRIR